MSDEAAEWVPPDSAELFDALRVLEARCRDNAAGLPQPDALPEIWAGVLFRIGDLAVLAPLEEIGEILEVPREVTPVPGTRDWVFGIANNRGTLLPMFDLRAFLFGAATNRSVRNRVLVVRRDEFPVGLLVGDVTGIRHFEEKSRVQQIPEIPDALEPFVSGSFKRGRRPYPVCSMRRLTLDGRFNLTAG